MPSDVSDTELLKTFRKIGEAHIQSLVLTYFKTELNDYSLDMSSRVFPVPTNGGVII